MLEKRKLKRQHVDLAPDLGSTCIGTRIASLLHQNCPLCIMLTLSPLHQIIPFSLHFEGLTKKSIPITSEVAFNTLGDNSANIRGIDIPPPISVVNGPVKVTNAFCVPEH
ncbi:hypothetical protein Hamer_G014584 [Homarus americanus]|uniref:Uncharacterized protein n=1 Tax=Homarus americanus TaxID=6706 RepID=A0A8J5N5J3_HOMAM|nr:hypothetical protein Hamer_G014584 [Homarus americanus]